MGEVPIGEVPVERQVLVADKNCAQEIRQVRVSQLALPPIGPRLGLKCPSWCTALIRSIMKAVGCTYYLDVNCNDIFCKCQEEQVNLSLLPVQDILWPRAKTMLNA